MGSSGAKASSGAKGSTGGSQKASTGAKASSGGGQKASSGWKGKGSAGSRARSAKLKEAEGVSSDNEPTPTYVTFKRGDDVVATAHKSDWASSMPGMMAMLRESIALVLTDPPYGELCCCSFMLFCAFIFIFCILYCRCAQRQGLPP